MTTTYVPREGSVAALALEYLRNNAPEPKSALDICADIDSETRTFWSSIGIALREGVIASAKDDDGHVVFSVGNGEPIAPAAEPQPSAAAPAADVKPPRGGFKKWLSKAAQESAEAPRAKKARAKPAKKVKAPKKAKVVEVAKRPRKTRTPPPQHRSASLDRADPGGADRAGSVAGQWRSVLRPALRLLQQRRLAGRSARQEAAPAPHQGRAARLSQLPVQPRPARLSRPGRPRLTPETPCPL